MTNIIDVLAAARAQLLAPGAPFEVTECNVGGQPTRVYRNAFPTLPALIEAGRTHGDKVFLVYQGQRWTFTRFFAEVDAVAAALRQDGLAPGDRVAIAMRNRPEWAVAFAAAALLGAIPAPLNSFGLRGELRSALADVEPAVLFCDPERLARIEGDTGVPDCPKVSIICRARRGSGNMRSPSQTRYRRYSAHHTAYRPPRSTYSSSDYTSATWWRCGRGPAGLRSPVAAGRQTHKSHR